MRPVIAVGLSGGVDSAVAAYKLAGERDEGKWETVIGVSHVVWPDSPCCDASALARAERVAQILGIPFFTIDMQSVFDREVVSEFASSYIAGRTPNPCVRCNEKVRFTAFRQACARVARERGLLQEDAPLYFATGHYARIENRNGRYFLRKAVDEAKDQAYMLYRVPASLFSYLRFPLGGITKRETFRIADKLRLPSAAVKESQDACFVMGDYVDFITCYMSNSVGQPGAGPIIGPDGETLGTHPGYIHYTVGQRKGLGLGNGPWYVIGVDPDRNAVYVGRREALGTDSFLVRDAVWSVPPPVADKPLECKVRVRYNSVEVPCRVEALSSTDFLVKTRQPVVIAPGQSAVFFDSCFVAGGGFIEKMP